MALEELGYDSGVNISALGRQAFGAKIVTATLDAVQGMSSSATSMSSVMQMAGSKEGVGGQVVAKTLDAMTSKPSSGAMSPSYDFQTQVLNAVYAGKGTVVDAKG